MYAAVYIEAMGNETLSDFSERLAYIKKLIPNQRVWGLFNYKQLEAPAGATAENIHNRYNDIIRISGGKVNG